MTKNAKTYAGFVILSGLTLVVQALLDTSAFSDTNRFVIFCAAGTLASVMKVKLPGLQGTMSANFFAILISIALLNCSETVAIAALCGVAQCVLRSRRAPTLVQTAFNTGALSIASA